ncbi:MAG: PspC domain-containing protein [Candidatus Aenigmatarchaeota archaeon]
MAAKRKAKTSRTAPRRTSSSAKRLYRSSKNKILGGVCGGIGEYLNVDPTIVRLLWALSAFVWGAGILLYLLAWLIIPRNPNQRW